MNILKKIYIWMSGYSYANLGRLFLRLFVGVMMIHFAVRQIADYQTMQAEFPVIFGMSGDVALVALIVIELLCSLFIMFGFLMRLMIIPQFVAMAVAEHYLLTDYIHTSGWQLTWQQPGYLPLMFLGIYFFLLLVGPGKISVDYFLSLHFIHSGNRSESYLEEV